ncbi:hypothetical protein TWF594_009469 [Orbilia oligospora]|nr:hypothetical protein TWF594_009469 [Orbilia oligospora]
MADLSNMAHFTRLPLEIKLQILENLGTEADLKSCCSTCRSLYNITETVYWNSITKSVYENETANNITPQLVAIRRIRFVKATNSPQDIRSMTVWQEPEQQGLHISDFMKLRKTIRWFRNAFFRSYLLSKPEEAPPSDAEIRRVDDALGILWLWIEASQEHTRRNEVQIKMLISWATHGKINPPLRGSIGQEELVPQSGLLLAVYSFLISLLGGYGKALIDSHPSDTWDLTQLSTLVPCVSSYIRVGIANLILIEKGLDGVKTMLESPLDSQLRAAARYIEFPIQTRDDQHCLLQSFDIRNDTTSFFLHLIDDLWDQDICRSAFASRPLWREKDQLYTLNSPPWSNRQGFDLRATIWDDERLLRWGYHRSIGTEVDESVMGVPGHIFHSYWSLHSADLECQNCRLNRAQNNRLGESSCRFNTAYLNLDALTKVLL